MYEVITFMIFIRTKQLYYSLLKLSKFFTFCQYYMKKDTETYSN